MRPILRLYQVLRFSVLFVLVAASAGCDAFRSEATSTFDATYRGARSGTLAGSVYAQSFRYNGLGTSNIYQIKLDGSPQAAGPFLGAVTFVTGGLDRPVGTYGLGFDDDPGASALITVPGGPGGFNRTYYATSGALRIEQVKGGRVHGTFHVTDSVLYGFLPEDTLSPSEPDSVVFEGRFDATLGE